MLDDAPNAGLTRYALFVRMGRLFRVDVSRVREIIEYPQARQRPPVDAATAVYRGQLMRLFEPTGSTYSGREAETTPARVVVTENSLESNAPIGIVAEQVASNTVMVPLDERSDTAELTPASEEVDLQQLSRAAALADASPSRP